jgi:hypothetical protein
MSQTKAQLLGPLVADDIAVNGGLNLDNGTLKIDPDTNRVGINNANPTKTLDVGGDVNLTDLYYTAEYPNIRPSLDLAFAYTKELDSRITFTRSSTATFVGADGLIKTAAINTPRFDHDPITGESLGLLIEESGTNLGRSSEDYSNTTYWNPTNTTISTNVATSPDGNLTADNIIPSSGTNASRYLYYSATPYAMSASAVYTTSIFVKKNGLRYFALQAHDNLSGSGHRAGYDLDTGTVVTSNNMGSGTGVSASIISYPNGWYRCILTGTTAPTGTQGKTAFSFSSSLDVNASVGSITADGLSGGYVWGHQVEQGSFPTSYIPTTTAAVTRTGEFAIMSDTAFTPWYNQSEGTVYAEFNPKLFVGSDDGGRLFRIYNTSNIGSNRIDYVVTSTGIFQPYLMFSGVQYSTGNASIGFAKDTNYKISLSIKQDDFVGYINGSQSLVDNTVTLSTLNAISLGSGDEAGQLNGHLKRFIYYPRRLNNTQMQNITL